MPYPWFSFGDFVFRRNEWAVDGSDVGWNRAIKFARTSGLGSASDDIQVTSIGSMDRSFEVRLSPARYAELGAKVGTTDDFTDLDRPTPNTQRAFLSRITQLSWEARLCSDGDTERVIRTRIELISQSA